MTKSDLLLEAFLPYQLSYLSNLMGQKLAELYTNKFGVTHTEWKVMAVLGVSSGVSAGFVAEKTAMDKVAVSRAIKSMIKNDLVSRMFSDDDKRRSELKLSKLGRETYEEIVPLVQKYEKELLSNLSSSDREGLDRILDKLTKYAEE